MTSSPKPTDPDSFRAKYAVIQGGREPASDDLRGASDGTHTGGQGGGGGDMGDRIEALETEMKSVRTDLAFIKGKLDDMPTKDWMNTRMIAYVGALAVLITILRFAGGTP